MNILNNARSHIEYYFFVSANIIYVLINKTAVPSPDTTGYLSFDPGRSSVYPIFINAVKALSGNFFPHILLILQTGFYLWACVLFVRKFSAMFKMQRIYTISMLLYFTYILFIMNRPRVMYTESLAYPLFLVLLISCFKWISSLKLKDLLAVSGLLLFLLQLRGQFLFMIPLLIVFVILLYWRKLRTTILLCSLIVAVFLTNSLIDRSYHAIVHGYFHPTPFTGHTISALPLYISKAEDVEHIADPEEKIVFETIHRSLQEKGMLAESFGEFRKFEFSKAYNEIIWHTVCPVFQEESRGDGDLDFDDYKFMNSTMISISMQLIKCNPGRYFKALLHNFATGISKINIAPFFLTLFILIYFSIKKFLKIYIFILFNLFGALLNYVLITISVFSYPRISWYSSVMIFTSILILISEITNKQSSTQNM